MPALSGFAPNQLTLSFARMGVGIGEATASPTAYSLISDYFPKRQRATAIAIYSSGLYIGGGVSLFIGAKIVEYWNAAYPAGRSEEHTSELQSLMRTSYAVFSMKKKT